MNCRAVEGVQDIAHELYKRLEDFRKQSPTFATVSGERIVCLVRVNDQSCEWCCMHAIYTSVGRHKGPVAVDHFRQVCVCV